jgi:hypothetical protein
MTEQEFQDVAAEYCRNPQVRYDLLQFQDQNPGISGSYDAATAQWHLHFNGAHGSGATHEDAYAELTSDEDRRWQEHLKEQAEWANA